MKTLMPFQETGRDFLAMRPDGLLGDDMGIGKTLQAIEAAKKCGIKKGLVVCPLSVRRTWVKVLNDQYPEVFVKELTTTRAIPHSGSFNVINYDLVWREPMIKMLHTNWPLIILDESHFLKSIEAKRTKAILGKGGLYNVCERRWALTGTPILNRPIELYPILRALWPERLGDYKNYYRFAYQYCAGFKDTFGFNATGASNLGELARIVGPIMLRRMKEEVLDQLPDIIYEKIYLDPTDKLNALTEKEKSVDISEVKSIRKAVGLVKMHAAIIHIEDVLLTKSKIVAFTWHKDVAHGLKDHFKDRAVLFTGEESIDEKEKAKEAFIQYPGVQVFIGQLEAAGIGIDGLQLVCDTCIFVEMYSVPGKIKQAIDRLRRIGQERGVLAQFLIAENSIDEKIVDALVAKGKNIKTILNEKGGAAFVKCRCDYCKRLKEIAELKRVENMSVCKNCEKLMEVL